MTDKKSTENTLVPQNKAAVDETMLYERVSAIIENRKYRAASYVNSEVTLMFWEVGQFVSSLLLGGERAEYGKRIVAKLSAQLTE